MLWARLLVAHLQLDLFIRRHPPGSRGWWLAVLLLAVPFVLLAARCTPPRHAPPPQILQEEHAPEDEKVLADLQADGGTPRPRRPLPAKPTPTQKKPPCGPGEHAINGACYMRAHPSDFPVPCQKPTVEYQGSCWIILRTEPQRPTSLTP